MSVAYAFIPPVVRTIPRPIFAGYPAFVAETEFFLEFCAQNIPEWQTINLSRIEAMITNGFTNKRTIKDLLGLGSDYRRTVRHEVTPYYSPAFNSDDWWRSVDVMRFIMDDGWLDNAKMVDYINNGIADEHGRKTKLMRFVARWEGKNKQSITKPFKTALERSINVINDIKRLATVDYVISANPMDIFFNSSHSSFTSCMSITKDKDDTSYKAGLTTYAADAHTFILYRASTSRKATPIAFKTGRIVCHMDEEYMGLSVMRSYGDTETEAAQSILSKILGWEITGEPIDIDQEEFSGYYDGQTYVLACPEFNPRRQKLSLDLAPSTCLACGKGTDTTSWLVCGSCMPDYTCESCGCGIDDGDECYGPNGIACNGCFSERYSSCHHCGDVHEQDDLEDVNGSDYCEHCASVLFASCHSCDSQTRKIRMIYINDKRMCSNCAEKYQSCNTCGDHFQREQMVNSCVYHYSKVCSDCYQEERQPTPTQALDVITDSYDRRNCRYIARVWLALNQEWSFIALNTSSLYESQATVSARYDVAYVLPRSFALAAYN